RLTHPAYGVAKTYLCQVPGPVPKAVGRKLLSGVELEDGLAKADKFRVVDSYRKTALVEIVVHEGRKHIVRRMLAEVGHPVSRLIRRAVGPRKLGNLRPGKLRPLTRREASGLCAAAGEGSVPVTAGPRASRSPTRGSCSASGSPRRRPRRSSGGRCRPART